MFSWLSGLFGGSKNTAKTLDIIDSSLKGVGNWIDEKDFTPEEKSKALAKAVDSHLELVKETNKENSVRSLTRRWIACITLGWVLLSATSAMILAVLKFNAEAKIILDVISSVGSNILVITIMGFYFGVAMLRK